MEKPSAADSHFAAERKVDRRVEVGGGASGQGRGQMEPGFGPQGDDVDHASEAALVLDVERSLGHLDALDLRKIDVKGGGIHAVRAGAVDPAAVDQDVDVVALQAAHHDIVGDGALADLGQAGHAHQGFAQVDRETLPDLGDRHAFMAPPHRDRLIQLDESHRKGGLHGLAGLDHDRDLCRFHDSLECGGDQVVPRVELGKAELAAVAGHGLLLFRSLPDDGDGDAWEAFIRRADGDSGNFSQRLGLGICRQQQPSCENRQGQTFTLLHVSPLSATMTNKLNTRSMPSGSSC